MNKRKGLREETKELYASLGRSLFLCFVALFAIVTATVAWFASNNRVDSGSTNVSASGEPLFYIATKSSDEIGVYDYTADDSSYLAKSLSKIHRIDNNGRDDDKGNYYSKYEGLPQFLKGTKTFGDTDYIIADTDGLSLMINNTSNVNNTHMLEHIGPGANGQLTFYVIRNTAALSKVSVTLSINPYKLVPVDNESGKAKAEPISGTEGVEQQVKNFIGGHMFLFQGIDDEGNYSTQLKPVISSNSVYYNLDIPLTGKVTEVIVYWNWPYRFDNIVYYGQKNSLFSSSEGLYDNVIEWINTNRELIVKVNTEDVLKPPSIEMTNADLLKWNTGYNKADQIIGDNVAYFIWTITANDDLR